jgi:hypothetical protein
MGLTTQTKAKKTRRAERERGVWQYRRKPRINHDIIARSHGVRGRSKHVAEHTCLLGSLVVESDISHAAVQHRDCVTRKAEEHERKNSKRRSVLRRSTLQSPES